MQTITNYKGKLSRELPTGTILTDELNDLYARFDSSNTEARMRAPAVLDGCVITLALANVSKTFLTGPHYQDVYSEHALTNW